MREAVAAEASVINPVDMISSARGEQYEACLRAVIEDPQVDSVIAIFTSLESIDSMKVADGIMKGVAGVEKPVLVCFMGKVANKPAVERMKRAGLPVYTFPEEAAHALSALARHRQWLSRPEGRIVEFDGFDRATIRTTFDLAVAAGRKTLTLAEAQIVLEACGIAVPSWRTGRDPSAAAAAATELGFPVAVKLDSAVLTHKSDLGGVRLGLEDADAVARAAESVLALGRERDPEAGVIVQKMAGGGTEVILGSTADPKFGPLLMFGLGGIFVEILKDVSFRVHPVSDVDALQMIEAIKGYPILRGARGHAPVSIEALQELILRVSQLLAEFPEIQELDVNPFLAGPTAAASVAVDARISLK
jgi:acetyltransferase